MIALLIMTDGRLDYLRQTVASAHAALEGDILERWMFDDSGDDEHRDLLQEEFPEFTLLHAGPRQGFGGAIRQAWSYLHTHSVADYVFHLEGDFTFNEVIRLDDLVTILNYRPHLAQVALRRQAWNDTEKKAGGIVEANPGDYVTHLDRDNRVWLEHKLFFTTNPCLYRMSLVDQFEWPDGPNSEGRFGIKVREHGYNFAFFGPREEGPKVHHIGEERKGSGY